MRSKAVWLALLMSAGSVAWLWLRPEPELPGKSDATRSLAVPYTIDEAVWPDRHPGLCEIAQSLGLDLEKRAATLAENAGRGRCADPQRKYRIGETVRIVVWVPPGSQYGKSCLRTCGAKARPGQTEPPLQR